MSTLDDAEVLTDPVDALALRRPDAPADLTALAALKGEAVEVIESRVLILETLRKAAIRATHPEDWLLFRAPQEQGGQVVGYLQDCGCDRVRDLWGIEVYDVSKPEKIQTNDPAVFHYLQSANGRCKVSTQIVEQMEGGRSSTDDFCRDKTGADLELAVRKACRANLDGNITRELAGMKSVPLAEIERAWAGSPKKSEHCRRGRGFGTARERQGGESTTAPDGPAPKCGVCGATAKYRPANDRGPAWWSCPDYLSHRDQKWSMDAEKWAKAQQPAPAPPKPEPSPAPPPPPPPKKRAPAPPVTAADIFGREPGEDG